MMDRDRELHEMADEGRALVSGYIKRDDALNAIGIRWGERESPAKVIPSADVAPVVRCNDCKWRFTPVDKEGVVRCPDADHEWFDYFEGFCSFGERKNDETD